jgi:putative ABC transport system substrate-binding protein
VIERRAFLRFAAAVLAAAAISVAAQQQASMPHIGIVTRTNKNVEAFVAALRERGYVDGSTVVVERRRGADEFFSSSELSRIAVVTVGGSYQIALALKASKTVPIVAVDLESDPVGSGFAKSLARPGGRITGVFLDLPELGGKQIQLLREMVPSIRRVGILWDEEIGRPQYEATMRAALAAGLTPVSLPYRNPAELATVAAAFDRARAERVDGLVILTSPSITSYLAQIADLALKNRLPTVSPFNRFPEAGGAIAYGPDLPDLYQQVADYVDRILKGAKPGELPIQRPSRFVLGVNVKTAKALGLLVPQSLLARADEVIQ